MVTKKKTTNIIKRKDLFVCKEYSQIVPILIPKQNIFMLQLQSGLPGSDLYPANVSDGMGLRENECCASGQNDRRVHSPPDASGQS